MRQKHESATVAMLETDVSPMQHRTRQSRLRRPVNSSRRNDDLGEDIQGGTPLGVAGQRQIYQGLD